MKNIIYIKVVFQQTCIYSYGHTHTYIMHHAHENTTTLFFNRNTNWSFFRRSLICLNCLMFCIKVDKK